VIACYEERQLFVRAGEAMEVDDSSFFGTPEVMLRPRQRLGADGLEAYPTPVAGFSTNKKLRDNMSFSAFSPGSALRKPFNDVSATIGAHCCWSHAVCTLLFHVFFVFPRPSERYVATAARHPTRA
jgi:hypothetical protein